MSGNPDDLLKRLQNYAEPKKASSMSYAVAAVVALVVIIVIFGKQSDYGLDLTEGPPVPLEPIGRVNPGGQAGCVQVGMASDTYDKDGIVCVQGSYPVGVLARRNPSEEVHALLSNYNNTPLSLIGEPSPEAIVNKVMIRGVLELTNATKTQRKLVWQRAPFGSDTGTALPLKAAQFRFVSWSLQDPTPPADPSTLYLGATFSNSAHHLVATRIVEADQSSGWPAFCCVAAPEYPREDGRVHPVGDDDVNVNLAGACGVDNTQWMQQEMTFFNGAFPPFYGALAGPLIFAQRKVEKAFPAGDVYQFPGALAVSVGQAIDENSYTPSFVRQGKDVNLSITLGVPYLCFLGKLSSCYIACCHPKSGESLVLCKA